MNFLVRKWRNRYLIFEIHSPKPIELSKLQLLRHIFDATLKLYGEVGAASIHINLIDYDDRLMRGIIRCNHRAVVKLRAALAIISEINSIPVLVHVVKVTGTLRKAREILNSLPRGLDVGDEEAVPCLTSGGE
ncbi:MAG: hypothetical protein DRJ20_01070 [Candidatus Methanomethylicota archaeon]|uniref:Ribonuclease P protein component 2 n=1 Tax=Thermoproteota archaeon TaxID=2056631 RepID=A0A497EXY0_9CREN|nr:MAG: hypothetical protein DRJ20_01070 [Candidatus Verstraetearchaeota archaeon]